jgi:hypothetical protein
MLPVTSASASKPDQPPPSYESVVWFGHKIDMQDPAELSAITEYVLQIIQQLELGDDSTAAEGVSKFYKILSDLGDMQVGNEMTYSSLREKISGGLRSLGENALSLLVPVTKSAVPSQLLDCIPVVTPKRTSRFDDLQCGSDFRPPREGRSFCCS